MNRLEDLTLSLISEYVGIPDIRHEAMVMPYFRQVLAWSQICRRAWEWYQVWYDTDLPIEFHH